MEEDKCKHVTKLPVGAISESVSAKPQVPCTQLEIEEVLMDLRQAVEREDYISPTPTRDNPALSDDYVFQYPCKLMRKDALNSSDIFDEVLIYIKINNRKIPYKKVIIISFHKNRKA